MSFQEWWKNQLKERGELSTITRKAIAQEVWAFQQNQIDILKKCLFQMQECAKASLERIHELEDENKMLKDARP